MTKATIPVIKNCRHCNKEFNAKWNELQCSAFRGKKYRSSDGYKSHKENNLKSANRYKMKKYYGMTEEQFNKKLEEQGNKCAICSIHKHELNRRMNVDHDHSCCPGKETCGKCVRGLICGSCNMALGAFRDNKVLLENAIKYLDSFGGKS